MITALRHLIAPPRKQRVRGPGGYWGGRLGRGFWPGARLGARGRVPGREAQPRAPREHLGLNWPYPGWPAAAVLGTLAAVATMTLLPAWLGTQQSPASVLQAETA